MKTPKVSSSMPIVTTKEQHSSENVSDRKPAEHQNE
jgi:hypothetical protein